MNRLLDWCYLIAAIGIGWELIYLYVGSTGLTSPLTTLALAYHALGDRSFQQDALATGTAFVYSVGLSVILGVALGCLLGVRQLPGDIFEPLLQSVYSVPKLTFYPLILLIFGLGLSSKVAFGVIHGVIPVTIFTLNAIRNINPIYLKVAAVHRLNVRQQLMHVVIPATIPEVFTGVRVGFCLTLLGVIIGEMFASQHGLGFRIMNAIDVNNVGTIMTVILVLFIFAIVSNSLLMLIENRLHRSASSAAAASKLVYG
jgi:NitT/TauT family transport system permease protein